MKKRYAFLFLSAIVFSSAMAQNIVILDASKEYQIIEGLGGFGHFSAGATFNDMYYKQVVDNLGCTFFRQELTPDFIKSSDSLASSQLNIGPGTGMAMNVGFLNALKQKGDFKYIFTVWSPPPFMKKNNIPNCECCVGYNKDYRCDTTNYLLPSQYSNYAQYLGLYVKYIKQTTGIDIYGLGLQNEPMFNEPYNSALLYAPAFANCLKVVGSHFAGDTELTGVKFFGAEHAFEYARNHGGDAGFWGGGESSKYLQYLLDSASTRQYVHAFATHGNVDGIVINNGSATDWSRYATITSSYGKKMWATEMYMDGTNWNTIFNSAEGIYLALKYGNLTAWAYWVLGDQLYTSNLPDARTASVKQFFRFIRPGYKQVEISGAPSGTGVVAFKNGLDLTVVLLNENAFITNIDLGTAVGTTLPSSFQIYRSSVSESCAYLGKSSSTHYTLPAKSITTLYYKASEPDVQWAPGAPQNVQSSNITETSARLTWMETADWTMKALPSDYIIKTNAYYVYRKETNGSYTKIIGQATSNLYYNLSSLKPATSYTYAIIGRDELSNLSSFAEITFKTSCSSNCPDTTAISNVESPDISVYPNPAKDIIKVESASIIKSIRIFNVLGDIKLVADLNSFNPSVNVSALSDGIYVMELMEENNTVGYKRFLVHK